MTLTPKTRARSVMLLGGWLAVCVALGAAAGLAVSAASAQSGTGCVGCGPNLCPPECGTCKFDTCVCNARGNCIKDEP